MELNILDFVLFTQRKNGKYKITHDDKNIENIYLLLRNMGFGFIREGTHKIYFKRENSGTNSANFSDLKKAFFKAIKDCDNSKLPENITLLDVYKYYRSIPFRKDQVFSRYLEYTFTEQEVQTLIIKSKFSVDKKNKLLQKLYKI